MKILIAPDSFKGSLTTLEVANSIEKGIKNIIKDVDIVKIPIADGGEGTVEALVLATNGRYEEAYVVGPLGKRLKAKYGILDEHTSVIEMAATSGLTLIDKDKLDVLSTTTYGTGELVKIAMEKGYRKIYVGLGGSCTNDGGVGFAQALGVSFTDECGNEIGYGGGELRNIREIDISNIHPLLKDTEIIGISDVDNPLYGLEGATRIFGPQKGATAEVMELLDDNLEYLSKMIKKYLDKDVSQIPGAGAAGGLGAGMIAFCDATIQSGIEKVLDIANVDKHLKNADMVITGEGQIDKQSIYGKVPVGIAKRAAKHNTPVIVIAGSVGDGASEVYSYGIDLIIDIINKPMTLDEAIKNASLLIEKASENIMRMVKIHKKLYQI